ncbi:MAG: CvpA family protein [bacterium]|nr:CvpA family protein [bacterium]
MQLYWVDIAIIVIIGLSLLTGLFRGFVKELVALCVWIAALWLGFHYSQNLDPWLKSYIQEQSARTAVAFILILFATLFVGGVINALLSFILKRAGLSGTDRTLGMGFGFIRGVFIVALIMVAVRMTSLPYEQYARESQLYARFDPVVAVIYDHLPEVIKQMKKVDTSENIIDTVPTV